jgi:sugar phosphate permease
MRLNPTLRKGVMIVVGCLVYAIGYYHRNCPAAMVDQMAAALHRPTSDLGILSSTYFWAYAAVQPFIGSLSDLYDSKYIVSISLIFCSIGTAVCGASRNFYLTCFARAIVGLSCGCLYVPVCRTFAQWFTVRQFPYAQSFILACGGLGGLLAPLPLRKISFTTWPYPYYVGAGLSLLLSGLNFLFMQGSPHPITLTLKQAWSTLIRNIRSSLTYRDFWLLAFWKFLTPSTYQSLTAAYGVKYLKTWFPQHKAVDYITMTSIAWTVGAPFLAVVPNWVKTRKWCLVVCSIVATGLTIGFTCMTKEPSEAGVMAMLFGFALAAGASMTIAAVIFKEMLSKELVGTLMGCGNLVMVGTAVEEVITASILKKYEDPPPLKAFRYGFWGLSTVSCGIGTILTFLIKDTWQKARDEEDREGNEQGSIEEPMIDNEALRD